MMTADRRPSLTDHNKRSDALPMPRGAQRHALEDRDSRLLPHLVARGSPENDEFVDDAPMRRDFQSLFDQEGARRHAQRLEFQLAYGAMLTTCCVWHHVVVLTASFDAHPQRLLWEFSLYVRRLEKMAQRPVYWAAIVERGRADKPHVHALLTNTENLRLDQIRRWWRLGVTWAARYNPAEAGAYYIVKELPRMVDEDDDNYRFRLPVPEQ